MHRRGLVLGLAVLAVASAPASLAMSRAPASAATCLTAGLGGQGWTSVASTHVRIWALTSRPADVARAHSLAALVEPRIFARFETLLGKTPPTDGAESCPHGGDARLDVYISPNGTYDGGAKHLGSGQLAVYRPYSGEPCDPGHAGFVVAQPNVNGWVLAHELYHAFQAAFPRLQLCIDYSEWDEATATWAGDDAFPEIPNVRKHTAALTAPRYALSVPPGYQAWVFPYLAARRFGRTVLRKIEVEAGSNDDGRHIAAAIPGGLQAFWAQFSLLMWNQAPLPNVSVLGSSGASLRELKGIAAHPSAPAKPLGLNGAASRTIRDPFGGTGGLNPLGRDYRHYTFPDSRVRKITIKPGLSGGLPTVAALIKTAAGQWRSENWTGKSQITFCRNDPGEDIRELVVAYGNASPLNSGDTHGVPSIQLSTTCSYPRTIAGTFSGLVDDGKIDLTFNGSVTLTYLAADPVTHIPYTDSVRYRTTGGSVSWHVGGQCSGSGTLHAGDITQQFPSSSISLDDTPGKGWGYTLFVFVNSGVNMPYTCTDHSTGNAAFVLGQAGALIYNSDIRGPETNRYSTDLHTFKGLLDITPEAHQRWVWSLTGSGSVEPPSGTPGGG